MLDNIKQVAIKLLARREHSQHELLLKLESRGFSENNIISVIKELQRDGWQSDKRFCEVYVRSRKKQGYGPLRIVHELNARGISDQLIQNYISENSVEWEDLALEVKNKKFRYIKIENYKDKAKQMQFLHYRGFNSAQIRRAVNNFSNHKNESRENHESQ